MNAKCKFWQGEALRVKVQHHGSDKQWYLLYRGLDYGNGESEHRNSRNHAISATSPWVSMKNHLEGDGKSVIELLLYICKTMATVDKKYMI